MNRSFLIVSLCAFLFIGCNNSKDTVVPTTDQPSENLDQWLAKSPDKREHLADVPFASAPISKGEAEQIILKLFNDKKSQLQIEYGQQWDNRQININELNMPFFYHVFGAEPADGRSLFISMHGGGGAPANVNDQQYNNQKHLYDDTMSSMEGVYLAPRAPTNTWNLWHQNHIDDFFNVLIQMAVIKENVNPNKVYITGYSAGGDGVYQLAPRMADRWAAGAMMAGHPNEASPLGLKNTPFTIHMGALDSAYDRNLKAQEWGDMLDQLEASEPGSYVHEVKLHDGLGHWMELNDAVAFPWMANHKRNPIPEKVVWKQDDRHHTQFYWLGTPEESIETGGEIVVEYDKSANEINILSNYSNKLVLYINDDMLNLEAPVVIKYQGAQIAERHLTRSIKNIYESLVLKGDAYMAFSAKVTVTDNYSVQ